jgi:hypothetical protein
MELAAQSAQEQKVRVVTIKHPPSAVEGITADNSALGRIYDLPPQLAMLMMAAGWVRADTRTRMRRQRDLRNGANRRQASDRRSAA